MSFNLKKSLFLIVAAAVLIVSLLLGVIFCALRLKTAEAELETLRAGLDNEIGGVLDYLAQLFPMMTETAQYAKEGEEALTEYLGSGFEYYLETTRDELSDIYNSLRQLDSYAEVSRPNGSEYGGYIPTTITRHLRDEFGSLLSSGAGYAEIGENVDMLLSFLGILSGALETAEAEFPDNATERGFLFLCLLEDAMPDIFTLYPYM